MIFAFLSGIAGALFGLTYKIRSRLKLDYRPVLIAGGLWSAMISVAAALAFREPLYSLDAVLLGLPYGATITVSMIIYFRVIERTKLNISWTFIQLSMVIPFLMSVVAYGEHISWREGAGIALVFVTVFFLGVVKPNREGKNQLERSDRRAVWGLVVTFLLTGVSQCYAKVYQALPGTRPATTILVYTSIGMLFAGFGSLALPASGDPARSTERRPVRATLLFALAMSAARLSVPLFLLLALRTIKGAVVFPLRTMINIVLVVIISYLAYGERLKVSEAVGIPVAIAAITLLTI